MAKWPGQVEKMARRAYHERASLDSFEPILLKLLARSMAKKQPLAPTLQKGGLKATSLKGNGLEPGQKKELPTR